MYCVGLAFHVTLGWMLSERRDADRHVMLGPRYELLPPRDWYVPICRPNAHALRLSEVVLKSSW